MIVIGVDVHKHSLTAVAVDEAGTDARREDVAATDNGLVGLGVGSLSGERLWALEASPAAEREALERRLLADWRRAGAGAAEADGAGASCRTFAWQV